MITQLLIDVCKCKSGTPIARKGTPVRLVDLGNEWATVQLPSGQAIKVDAGDVSSGVHSPEEALPVLAAQFGIKTDTLYAAARQGRLMARQTGSTWLSTANAVQYAVNAGALRVKPAPTTQQTFVEMVDLALEHWDFEAASEPYRSSQKGLEWLLEHPLTDAELAEHEETHGPLTSPQGDFDWDWLSELAVSVSSEL